MAVDGILWGPVLLWSLVAMLAMTTIMQGAQGLGYSRLSLPFLFGTFVTANRHRAYAFGFVLFVIGGMIFALLYYLAFSYLGQATWWLGGFLGLLHGIFLLVVFLPSLPYVHPRMASEDDDPTTRRRLEPPGFLGLNYGIWTPITTLTGMLAYGIVLGVLLPLGPNPY